MPRNRRNKGVGDQAVVPSSVISGFTPRAWQAKAIRVIRSLARNGTDRTLMAACPGSGKTYGGLLVAADLRERVVKGACIIVVTPNLAIKSQWMVRGRDIGIELLPVRSGGDFRQDGLALTDTGFILGYQQVVNLRHSLREFCETHFVIVILDEVHHTEGPKATRDGNAWGNSIEFAFAAAKFKLCTTGTPFREGSNPIAFVDYDDERRAIAPVSYSYEEAIKDGVCRPIEFTLFEGQTTWLDKGETVSASFGDKLTKRRARQRLRAALSTDGEHPRTLLAAAHMKLIELRSGVGVDARAAGLVVACDTEHANAIAVELAAITGEMPLVVHNKIDDAQDQITAFAASNAAWIVGINMLSEGVDIPRLRVGVYASNIRASLYFHQFCGRFARVIESRYERSYVFMPADAELEAIALEIERERTHALGEDYTSHLRRIGPGGGGRPELHVLGSDAEAASVAVSGRKFSVEFIAAHRDRINDFRRRDVSYQRFSDGEVLKVLIDAGAIGSPAWEAA